MPTKDKGSSIKKQPHWRQLLTPGVSACLIIAVVCLIGGIVSLVYPRVKHSAETYAIVNLAPLDAVKPGDLLEQQFTSASDYESFGLYFANFSSPVHQGTLSLTIQPKGGPITTIERPLAGLLDNNFVYFDYALAAGIQYTIHLRTEDADVPVTFFTSTSEQNAATLSINGKHVDQHLVMVFTKSKSDFFFIWYFLMGVVLAAFIALVIVNKEFYVHQKSVQ